MRNEEGVTLIVLCVTIAIILILSTITINAVLSSEGILRKSQVTEELTENWIAKDEEGFENLLNELDNVKSELQNNEEIINIDLSNKTIVWLGDSLMTGTRST